MRARPIKRRQPVLSERTETALRYFRLAIDPSPEFEWLVGLARESAASAALLEDRDAFKRAVVQRIQGTRAALKLPPGDPQVLVTAATEAGV
jgi:hypothetical protein